MNQVVLSLISHTNVGKTTLARTLLRRDIGEVDDRAHVTDISEAHPLIEGDGARLLLWDTPGLGDTARLLKRLRDQPKPVAWLLRQTYDRFADRPLYCSQQAIRNIREDADVVLYLVNAAEDPVAAGYPQLELELLAWMRKPVLLLLNQVGDDPAGATDLWKKFVESHPIVGGVLSLDAFTRCWVEESTLLREAAKLLDDEQRATMDALIALWDGRQRETFERSCRLIAEYLVETAADRIEVEASDGNRLERLGAALKFKGVDQRRFQQQLAQRLNERTVRLMRELIAAHGLEGESATPIEERIQEFQTRGGIALDETTGALAGGVVSGLLSGLAADVLSGGLTLGGGMIAGGILGALGGSAIGKAYRVATKGRAATVAWAEPFLDQLTAQAILRYLAVAHFGRGRGRFRDLEQPEHWKERVREQLAGRLDRVRAALGLRDADTLRSELGSLFTAILSEEYPGTLTVK